MANCGNQSQKITPLKLTKIRFTSWRDQSVLPRSLEFQQQLDALTTRIGVLSKATAQIKLEQTYADSKMLQKSLARITDDLEKTNAARTSLLSAEKAAADSETRAATEHKRAGTFGYQVWDETGARVAMVVDEAGIYLPVKVVYSYEVVDENPPLPEWAKKGKVGRFK